MPTLDELVSRAVFRARLLEYALHLRGGWSIECAGRVAPAVRELGPDRITFVARFTAPGEYGPGAWLRFAGQPAAYLPFDRTVADGEELEVRWELLAGEVVPA